MKIKNKKFKLNNKAFTLIELLVVIAIIGILSSIVLVSLSSGKDKAKDAAIISSAETIMKAAQIASSGTNNYVAWYGSNTWIGSKSECDSKINPSMPNRPEVVEACKNIIDNVGTTGEQGYEGSNKLFLGSANTPSTPKLTIMAALPYAKTFYCIGSNGGTSVTTGLNKIGCGGAWLCSGCAWDPKGGGS